jgi:hypothetical protein
MAQGFVLAFLSGRFVLVIAQGCFSVFLSNRFLVGLLEVLFTVIFFSYCFEMAKEGFLRACLPTVGGVELWQVSFLAALKWMKVSQGLSCLLYVV